MGDQSLQHLERLQRILEARLQALEIQTAKLGPYVPAHVVIEIEEVKKEKDAIEKYLTSVLIKEAGETKRLSTSEQITNLLRLAERAINTEDYSGALDLLYKAHQLNPSDTLILSRYNNVKRRQKILHKLRRIYFSYKIKVSSGSVHEASRSQYSGLIEILGDLEQDFPSYVKGEILRVIRLGEINGFYDLKYWENTKNTFGELSSHIGNHWLVLPILDLAMEWAKLSHQIAIREELSTYMKFGDRIRSYRDLAILLLSHPDDENIRNLASQRKENMIDALNRAMERRLLRAEESIDQGYFEIALEELNSLQEVYAPIEREFPGLLQSLSDFQEQKAQSEMLRKEALDLQDAFKQTTKPWLND